MLCKNKLANLDFKSKKIMQNTFCFPPSPLLFYFILIKKNPRMSLYQFTNKYHRILCLKHRHFWFVYYFSSLQLKTVWMNVPILSTKLTNPRKLIMCLALKKVRSLRLRLMKINPNLPRRCHFYRFSLTHRGLDSLTHKGFKNRRRNKIC